MALSKWEKDSVIVNGDGKVKELLILLKGTAQISLAGLSFDIFPGSIIGSGSMPGEVYGFTCTAKTDAATYSYDFSSMDDVRQIFTDNKKIAPDMCDAVMKNAFKIYTCLAQLLEAAERMYKNVMGKLEEYPALCRKTGDTIMDFPALAAFRKPPTETGIEAWKIDFLKGLLSYDESRKGILLSQTSLCIGYTCITIDFLREVKSKIIEFEKYIEDLRNSSQEFMMIYSALNAKVQSMGSEGAAESMPRLTGLLDQILVFSKAPSEITGELKESMAEYKALSDRYGVSDEHRKARRRLAKAFYPVYEAVLVQVFQSEQDPPLFVKMFLMFALLDETLVTPEELSTLYGFTKSYRPDPTGHVMCAWEWLRLIYEMKVEPSRNEFDMDYPSYLRELKNNGEIDEEMVVKRLGSPRHRLHFEISNMFTLGNRMTFGRISAFEPAFDDVNVIGSMERGYLFTEKINEEISFVTDRDYSIFYRNDIYSAPDQGITQLPIHREYRPNFILMPNMGSRFVLWQEIEGKRRQSSARMLLPIIMAEDLRSNMVRLCGDFRWEMCKTEQGIHWNDMRDPSLTAEYTDYLQFFKKNSAFTADIKEKIKAELKKFNNNYKNVFVNDYHDYLRYESNGSLRLLRPAREILAKYAPFTGEAKALLESNPTYQAYIERFNNHQMKDRKLIALTIKRFEKDSIPVPDELVSEVEYLSH